MQVKLREILHSKTREPVYGLTVPKEIKIFFSTETVFYAEKSGNAIIFTSGTSLIPTKEQIKNYKFEDCRA